MSAMDYVYFRLENIKFALNSPERRAFRDLLDKVAKALHDIEWVDSGDYGIDEDLVSINQCLEYDYVEFLKAELAVVEAKLERFNTKIK